MIYIKRDVSLLWTKIYIYNVIVIESELALGCIRVQSQKEGVFIKIMHTTEVEIKAAKPCLDLLCHGNIFPNLSCGHHGWQLLTVNAICGPTRRALPYSIQQT